MTTDAHAVPTERDPVHEGCDGPRGDRSAGTACRRPVAGRDRLGVLAGEAYVRSAFGWRGARHRSFWDGPAHGITGVRAWTFTEDGDSVVVRTRESWSGAPVGTDRDDRVAPFWPSYAYGPSSFSSA
ncbi:hypothetical protein [Streptomyces sp. CA-179760]|uniref:hypothetical protein n=1 Tax=Streptomyces sp. CA-179760 TaxID=3240054 RepID=UPI003D8D8266